MTTPVVARFGQDVQDLYRRCVKDLHYHAKGFLDLVMSTDVITATKIVINSERPTDGFSRLYEAGRLDLTVEALIVGHPEYHTLFLPEEVERANKRLADAGYVPRVDPH